MALHASGGLATISAGAALVALALLPLGAKSGMSDRDEPSLQAFDALRSLALTAPQNGHTLYWRDVASGQGAAITAEPLYRDPSGRWCRSYRILVLPDQTTSHHRACRTDNGHWVAEGRPASLQGGEPDSVLSRALDWIVGGKVATQLVANGP